MSDPAALSSFRWVTAPGLDCAGLRRLVDQAGGIDSLLGASAGQLRKWGVGDETLRRVESKDVSREDEWRAWHESEEHHMVPCWSERYPPQLATVSGAPRGLFVRGNPDVLALPQVAIVGSRSATAAGTSTARAFAAALARMGPGITSGLALGIDAAAHQGALDAGGITIAVCATGLDRVYPVCHEELAAEIAKTGALVSELPPGEPPRASQFPSRNRIISGLSVGTLVVEAGPRSGALVTARHAGDQGREVFAVPGSIHSPLSRGCHALIRQGAKLVETVHDIIAEVGPAIGVQAGLVAKAPETSDSPETRVGSDSEYRLLLDALGFDPVSVESLAERTGLTTAEVSSMLLILELEGRVELLPGGRYQQVPRQ